MVATAIIGSGIIGAGASIFGSSQASNAQVSSADRATAAQLNMFGQVRNALQPYMQSGSLSLGNLLPLIGGQAGGNPLTAPLTKPFNPTIEQLEATPGYKFTLDQGLKATQNGYAASGLGRSGAAQKGAINYAEGLAGNTYQNMFNNNLAQNLQAYNMLFGPASLGENAAGGFGNAAISTGGSIGNNIIGSGNAQAANWLNVGNQVGNAASAWPNSIIAQSFLQNQSGGGGGGGGIV